MERHTLKTEMTEKQQAVYDKLSEMARDKQRPIRRIELELEFNQRLSSILTAMVADGHIRRTHYAGYLPASMTIRLEEDE